jgi:hypothetical protein
MNITTIVQTLTPLADAFEFYAIPYHLTGSLATAVYVKTQAVQGMEVVADIKLALAHFACIRSKCGRIRKTSPIISHCILMEERILCSFPNCCRYPSMW